MDRKVRDYFAARVSLAWYVEPAARTVRVFTAADCSTLLHKGQNLTGDSVLPGFVPPLRELFARPGPEEGPLLWRPWPERLNPRP
jgi:hypothetical protein